jgi:hypothetical protein
VELKAAYAVYPQPVELSLPIFIIRMYGTERRYRRIGILEIAGIAVQGLYLRNGGSGTKRDHMIDAATLGAYEQIFGRAFATAVQPVLVLEDELCPLCDMGVEYMGVDINEHSGPDSFFCPHLLFGQAVWRMLAPSLPSGKLPFQPHL